ADLAPQRVCSRRPVRMAFLAGQGRQERFRGTLYIWCHTGGLAFDTASVFFQAAICSGRLKRYPNSTKCFQDGQCLGVGLPVVELGPEMHLECRDDVTGSFVQYAASRYGVANATQFGLRP